MSGMVYWVPTGKNGLLGSCSKYNTDEHKSLLSEEFTLHELNEAIKTLVNGKAAGIDDINAKLLKQLGSNCRKWLLKMFHACVRENNIPKVWRKAKTIAILKPGKNPKFFDQFLCYVTPTSSWNE